MWLPLCCRQDRAGAKEAAAEASRLRSILHDSPSGIIVIDSDSVVCEWSKQCERLFLWTREEAVGSDLKQLIIPLRHRGGHSRGIERYMRTGRSNLLGKPSLALTAIRKDGVEVSVRLSLALCKGGDGRNNFVGFLQDASHLDRLQADLREVYRLKRTADALIAGLDGAVAVLNDDLRIIFCNAEFDAYQCDRSTTEIAAELDIADTLRTHTQRKNARSLHTVLVERTNTIYTVRVHNLNIEGQGGHVMLILRRANDES